MFIMIDGVDGSGKSTIIDIWKKYLTDQGNTIFDLKNYWLTTGTYPDWSELSAYDFIFSGEPTYVGVGQAIRSELIKNGAGYSARTIAEAYALDRLILYKKIIIPALKNKKCVIQDRGISTSFAYQPLTDTALTPRVLARLEGNALALEYRPDHLVLLSIDPAVALGRAHKRAHKQDNAIFEKLAFQKKLARLFATASYRRLFTRRGTTIHDLPAAAKIDILSERAIKLLKTLLR